MKLSLPTLTMAISVVVITFGCHKKASMTAPPPPSATRESPVASTRQTQHPPVVAAPPTPEPARASERSSTSLEDYLNRLLDAYFDYDKADLRTDAQSALSTDSSELRSLLKEFPNAKFVVEGNCDERGSPEYNLALGDRRAKAAQEFLTQIGVPAERLTTISYGQERPVCTDHDEACWQKNRRAHVSANVRISLARTDSNP